MSKLFFAKEGIESARAVVLSIASLTNSNKPNVKKITKRVEEFYCVPVWQGDRDIRSLDELVDACFEHMGLEKDLCTPAQIKNLHKTVNEGGFAVVGQDIKRKNGDITCNYFIVKELKDNGPFVINYWGGQEKGKQKREITYKQFRRTLKSGTTIWLIKKNQ